jgi:hypothetical protein
MGTQKYFAFQSTLRILSVSTIKITYLAKDLLFDASDRFAGNARMQSDFTIFHPVYYKDSPVFLVNYFFSSSIKKINNRFTFPEPFFSAVHLA